MQSHYLSNEELEHYWFSYKTDSEIHGTSLEKFCKNNKITIKATNGLHVFQRNLDYEGVLRLMEMEGR